MNDQERRHEILKAEEAIRQLADELARAKGASLIADIWRPRT